MSENNGGDVSAFLAGFVIGGLVGAAAALILAPRSGEEIRSELAARSLEAKRASEERLSMARQQAELRAQAYRDRAAHVLDDAKSVTDSMQDRARIVLDEGKSKLTGAFDSGKERIGTQSQSENGTTEEDAPTDKPSTEV